MQAGLDLAVGDHGHQLAPYLVLEEHLGALHLEAGMQDLVGDLLVGWEVVGVVRHQVELEQKLSLDLLDQLLQALDGEGLSLLVFLAPLVPELHSHNVDNLAQREIVLLQVLLVRVQLHHNITQGLKVPLLLSLPDLDLLLD